MATIKVGALSKLFACDHFRGAFQSRGGLLPQEFSPMRRFVSALLCTVTVVGGVVEAGKDKLEGPTYKMDYLESKYGLKLKRTEQKPEGLALLFSFAKDHDALEVAKAFQLVAPGSKGDPSRIVFVCFDDDSVVIERRFITDRVGEITGTKDDSFWAIIKDFDPRKSKVRRIEARISQAPPKK